MFNYFLDSCFLDGCFLDDLLTALDKSKNCFFISLTLGKSKINPTTNSLRNWMPEELSGELIHTTGTPPWIRRPMKISTSSQLYADYFRLPTFLDCSRSQSFDSPPFSQHSQLGYLWLPTLHCAALAWLTGYHAMPAVTQCFPPNPYLKS